MPSKMAAAAAGMHQPYHDLTYYGKKYAQSLQVTGTPAGDLSPRVLETDSSRRLRETAQSPLGETASAAASAGHALLVALGRIEGLAV
jgi:hypothetical protein